MNVRCVDGLTDHAVAPALRFTTARANLPGTASTLAADSLDRAEFSFVLDAVGPYHE